MQKYQQKLKTLGYEIDITGIADNKTITAHHKYLKKREKMIDENEVLKNEKQSRNKK